VVSGQCGSLGVGESSRHTPTTGQSLPLHCLLPTAYCPLTIDHFSAEFNDFVEFSDCSVDNCCKEFSGAGRFAREIALVEVV